MWSIIVMPRAVIRRYSSSMSSTRGVRWLMWVVVTPAMSAATAETADNSSYQPRSIGSRDSAKAATAAATNCSAPRGGSAASSGDPARVGDQRRVEQLASARNRSTRPRRSAAKNRASAVASIEVNTRKGLRASSSASIGRNAVDTTGTGGVPRAGRRSRPDTCRRPRRGRRRRQVPDALPTRIAPWRSAVTRSSEPAQFAGSPRRR